MTDKQPRRHVARPVSWMGLLAIAIGSLLPGVRAHARDIVLIYGGYAEDNAFDRTIEQAKSDHDDDRIHAVVAGEDLEQDYGDMLLLVGDAEMVQRCDGGRPPDMSMLEDELERLRREMDFEGQLFAYDVAIDELACAGERMSASEAAELYVRRGLVHHKLGDEESAREDFRAALVLDPARTWDKRHSPKARPLFDEVRSEADGAYSYAVYAAEDGPTGSGIKIDGRALRTGEAMRLMAGEHLLSWRGSDGGDSGVLRVFGPTTLLGGMGILDFLFREPIDRDEEDLRADLIDEISWREGVDEVVLLDPIYVAGPRTRSRRHSSLARTGLGGGYSRTSQFDYGSAHLELWIRLYGVLHLEMRAQFDMATGRVTGVVDDGDGTASDGDLSDYYVFPSFQIGLGGRHTHGIVQPGGGVGVRVYFSGPSLAALPALIFNSAADFRAWDAPVVIRVEIAAGFILSAREDRLGRDLSWAGGGRGVFNATVGVGFIL